MVIDFTGRTALVTGATRGIGKAIAETLWVSGADVYMTGTRQDEIDALNNEMIAKLRLALLASAELERELAAGENGDTRRAKELSGILKDMAQLGRDLRFEEPRTLTVRFAGEAEEWSE